MSSLYLHIPFCEHKCIYCDFYSIAPQRERGPSEPSDQYEALVHRFLSALKKEIHHRAEDEQFHVSYETIFFGGGTPSLLSPSNIEEILSLLAGAFSIDPNVEVTLETNPGTVNLQKLKSFRSAGINRISIGIQSFHDDDLMFLSRIHSSEEARECVCSAFKAGFENVSFDLIFALPSQTRERWEENLVQAVDLRPTHISCYSLIVEPNTPLSRMVESKQVSVLSIEEDAALYERTIEFLTSHGYEQYEVSNFARPGYKSRHNGNYWNHANYLGFGPSAHSFWSEGNLGSSARRWWNIANVVGYAERLEKGLLPVAGEELLTTEQLREEEILLGLRSEGIDVAGFRRKYQCDLLSEHESMINELLTQRMALLEEGKLRLTSKGYLVCDEISLSLQE